MKDDEMIAPCKRPGCDSVVDLSMRPDGEEFEYCCGNCEDFHLTKLTLERMTKSAT